MESEQDESPQSPRAALRRYLELTRAGQYDSAAVYLDLPGIYRGKGDTLARHLKAVLDRHLWFNLEAISGNASGDLNDGLAPDLEQLGVIRGSNDAPLPVRMTRVPNDRPPYWRFSRTTVRYIPQWYETLGDRWVLDHLPPSLLLPGPFMILRWQWIALPIALLLAVVLGKLGERLTRTVFTRLVQRTRASWDDIVVASMRGPVGLVWVLALFGLFVTWLDLYLPAHTAIMRVLRAGFAVAFFWALMRLVDAMHDILEHSAYGPRGSSRRAVLPLLGRVAKVVIFALAVVAVLSAFGYPVAGLLAGLGLGGLAFALAAQKTVENLFGALSIGMDQPFREGDTIKVEDVLGSVEKIGLRSTRIRTLDRTLVTIPNGRLADMRIESLTARDRLRLYTVIGLEYKTTTHQLRQVLSGFEDVLRGHPKIWPDAVIVRFLSFGASSLDIEVGAWFLTADWGEFQLIRQEVLFKFIDIADKAGASFAFPTRTLEMGSPIQVMLENATPPKPSNGPTAGGSPPPDTPPAT